MCLCVQCPGATVGLDGKSCLPCQPGTEPSLDKTRCDTCTGNSASQTGICQSCDSGRAANQNKTSCNDVAESALTDASAAADVLESSNMNPQIELGMNVDAAEALKKGLATLKTELAAELAAALNIKPTELLVISIKVDGQRRRTQTKAAKVDIVISAANTSQVVRDLCALYFKLGLRR